MKVTAPGGGQAGRCLAVLLAVVAGGALAALPAPAAAASRSAASRSAAGAPVSLPAEVVIDRLAPQIPVAGSTLTLAGRVVNRGSEPIESAAIGLRVSPNTLQTRDAITFAADPAGTHDGRAPVPATVRRLPTLAPGASAPWSISVPVDVLALGRPGVYPIGIEVRAGAGRVGLTKTFLPWYPPGAQLVPTRMVLAWPLVDRPRVDAGGLFIDDGLAADLAPRGRLGRLLAAGAGKKVTWVVDPDLIGTVENMANGYEVAAGTDLVAGKSAAQAAGWLATLGTATRGNEMLALPFADPDVAALQHNGLGNHIAAAMNQDAEATPRRLDRPVRTDVAWPAGNQVDGRTLSTLRRAGTAAVILDDSAVPVTSDLSFTPSGRVALPVDGKPLTGLLADAKISRLLASDLSKPGAPVLVGQRFLAETAMITDERPGDSRVILVTPPRRWNPDPRLLEVLTAALRQARWLSPVPLSALEQTPPPAGVNRKPLAYPEAARREELAATYLGRVRGLNRQLRRYQDILDRPEPVGAAYLPAILRAESSGWRHSGARAFRYERGLRRGLNQLEGQVRILVSRRTVTLSSKIGKIPITVTNESNQKVDIRLRMESRVSRRLSVEPVLARSIGPQHTVTFEVPAQAVANGIVDVTARLETPGGQPYGPALNLRVRATNYGQVGLYVVGSAAGLLFVIVAVRLFRRIRAATRVGEVERSPDKVGV